MGFLLVCVAIYVWLVPCHRLCAAAALCAWEYSYYLFYPFSRIWNGIWIWHGRWSREARVHRVDHVRECSGAHIATSHIFSSIYLFILYFPLLLVLNCSFTRLVLFTYWACESTKATTTTNNECRGRDKTKKKKYSSMYYYEPLSGLGPPIEFRSPIINRLLFYVTTCRVCVLCARALDQTQTLSIFFFQFYVDFCFFFVFCCSVWFVCVNVEELSLSEHMVWPQLRLPYRIYWSLSSPSSSHETNVSSIFCFVLSMAAKNQINMLG